MKNLSPQEYWEKRAPFWIGHYPTPTRKWEPIIKRFLNKNQRTLELGCGDGRWSGLFAPNLYIGIDFSTKLIKAAKQNHPKYLFKVLDMLDIDYSKMRGIECLFSFTSLLHLSPTEIKSLAKQLDPNLSIVFIESDNLSHSEHCFNHNYKKLFGCVSVKSVKDESGSYLIWKRN